MEEPATGASADAPPSHDTSALPPQLGPPSVPISPLEGGATENNDGGLDLGMGAVDTKREPSPDLPDDLKLSPEVTKRPLEPTDHHENSDTKRLRLEEEVTHDDSVMDMDLDLEAMVKNVLGDIDIQMSNLGDLDEPDLTQSIEHTLPQEPAEPPATILSDPSKAMQIACLPSMTNFVGTRHAGPPCARADQ